MLFAASLAKPDCYARSVTANVSLASRDYFTVAVRFLLLPCSIVLHKVDKIIKIIVTVIKTTTLCMCMFTTTYHPMHKYSQKIKVNKCL